MRKRVRVPESRVLLELIVKESGIYSFSVSMSTAIAWTVVDATKL